MQVNPEDGPPEIYVTWSDPRMTDFKNDKVMHNKTTSPLSTLLSHEI